MIVFKSSYKLFNPPKDEFIKRMVEFSPPINTRNLSPHESHPLTIADQHNFPQTMALYQRFQEKRKTCTVGALLGNSNQELTQDENTNIKNEPSSSTHYGTFSSPGLLIKKRPSKGQTAMNNFSHSLVLQGNCQSIQKTLMEDAISAHINRVYSPTSAQLARKENEIVPQKPKISNQSKPLTPGQDYRQSHQKASQVLPSSVSKQYRLQSSQHPQQLPTKSGCSSFGGRPSPPYQTPLSSLGSKQQNAQIKSIEVHNVDLDEEQSENCSQPLMVRALRANSAVQPPQTWTPDHNKDTLLQSETTAEKQSTSQQKLQLQAVAESNSQLPVCTVQKSSMLSPSHYKVGASASGNRIKESQRQKFSYDNNDLGQVIKSGSQHLKTTSQNHQQQYRNLTKSSIKPQITQDNLSHKLTKGKKNAKQQNQQDDLNGLRQIAEAKYILPIRTTPVAEYYTKCNDVRGNQISQRVINSEQEITGGHGLIDTSTLQFENRQTDVTETEDFENVNISAKTKQTQHQNSNNTQQLSGSQASVRYNSRKNIEQHSNNKNTNFNATYYNCTKSKERRDLSLNKLIVNTQTLQFSPVFPLKVAEQYRSTQSPAFPKQKPQSTFLHLHDQQKHLLKQSQILPAKPAPQTHQQTHPQIQANKQNTTTNNTNTNSSNLHQFQLEQAIPTNNNPNWHCVNLKHMGSINALQSDILVLNSMYADNDALIKRRNQYVYKYQGYAQMQQQPQSGRQQQQQQQQQGIFQHQHIQVRRKPKSTTNILNAHLSAFVPTKNWIQNNNNNTHRQSCL